MRQTGAAPDAPATLDIGELSLLPIQTPTAICGVYPIVSASRLSSVVPVLTAAARDRVSEPPNVSARALGSERIDQMR